ncbi:uncharacterized protein LOC134822550 isoform X2 [Bolinopsis microptera]|uniref:uncharacterized protein LOC134822550 isoform X2 n=1 Tax=Bolinopsis microptera TaxID=2820187 RepID=UPI00307A2784
MADSLVNDDSISDDRPSRPRRRPRLKPHDIPHSNPQRNSAVRGKWNKTSQPQPSSSSSSQSKPNYRQRNVRPSHSRPHVAETDSNLSSLNKAIEERNRTNALNRRSAGSSSNKGKSPAVKTKTDTRQSCPYCALNPEEMSCYYCQKRNVQPSHSRPHIAETESNLSLIYHYNNDYDDSLLDKAIEEHNRTNTLNRRLAGRTSNKGKSPAVKTNINTRQSCPYCYFPLNPEEMSCYYCIQKQFTCPVRQSKIQDGWRLGTVKGQSQDAVYIKPVMELPQGLIADKDVHVWKDQISGISNIFPVMKGDKIEFLLSDKPQKKGNKLSAYRANIVSFCGRRSLIELSQFFVLAKNNVGETSTRTETMNSIMTCDALWFYIFNAKCRDNEEYQAFVSKVLDFAFFLIEHMDSFPSRKKEIFNLILDRDFIGQLKDEQDKHSNKLRLAMFAVNTDIGLFKKVMPILSSVVQESESDVANALYKMLMKFGNICDLNNWHDLPQIPTIEELFGDPLERVKVLKPVLLTSGYQNADDYLTVYYRLLRTECFSAIQEE